MQRRDDTADVDIGRMDVSGVAQGCASLTATANPEAAKAALNFGPLEFEHLRPANVFIHSSPHSGSTWLGYVLGSGEETAFVGELYRAWDPEDRVPCTICASRGLPECAVLAGLEATEPNRAFDVISSRNGKAVIVDISKRIEWTRQFLGRVDRDVKIIHLLKDPRSRWASLRRREAADMGKCISDWCQENQEIIDFTSAKQQPTRVAVYDIIAANPQTEIKALFQFVGAKFEPSVLRYWEAEHHGYAANGATSALVRHKQFTAPPSHFSTGDDQFYEGKFGSSFVDERWRDELPDDENEAILNNQKVQSLLNGLGYGLTKTSIYRLPRPPATIGKTRFASLLRPFRR